MDADELRSIEIPTRKRYREEPEAALLTLKAQGRIGEGITCKVERGKAAVQAGCIRQPAGMVFPSVLETCSAGCLRWSNA